MKFTSSLFFKNRNVSSAGWQNLSSVPDSLFITYDAIVWASNKNRKRETGSEPVPSIRRCLDRLVLLCQTTQEEQSVVRYQLVIVIISRINLIFLLISLLSASVAPFTC
ncbi:hypothetical protein ATANTOWER_030267 [Ataeniobius toweri]|uniref:Uncharacterized protein n=1 Tax=Ataeniobius toweri TaxID=208326 RepID=A0ABU7CC77_9TELE|nr:hypothetical protein [Ataeniobius toweri]